MRVRSDYPPCRGSAPPGSNTFRPVRLTRRHIIAFAALVAAGAQIQADCKVQKFLVEGDRVVGVRGRLRHPDTNEPGGHVSVRAKRVVLTAGGIGTPRTLHAAGLAKGLSVNKRCIRPPLHPRSRRRPTSLVKPLV